MKVTITTVTNTHIGSGEEVLPIEYVKLDGCTARINYPKALIGIAKEFSHKETILEQILNDSAKNLLEFAQRKDSLKVKLGIKEIFSKLNEKDDCNTIKNFLIKHNAIKYYINHQDEVTSKTREHCVDGNGDIYLPGSSIKGAIITCLLNGMLADINDESIEIIGNIFNKLSLEIYKKRDFKGKKGLDHTKDLLNIRHVGNDRFLYTIASLILVRDAYPQNIIRLNLLRPISVTHKKEINNLYNEVEFIPPNTKFDTEININIPLLRSISDSIDFNFTKGLFKLLGINQSEMNSKSDTELESEFKMYLLDMIDLSTKNIIDREKEWLDSLKTQNMIYRNDMESLISNLGVEKDKSSFIKLGWGSQFHAITIYNNLLLEAEERKNEKILVSYMKSNVNMNKDQKEMFDIDSLYSFPLSRRIVRNENNQASPIGWVHVKLES